MLKLSRLLTLLAILVAMLVGTIIMDIVKEKDKGSSNVETFSKEAKVMDIQNTEVFEEILQNLKEGKFREAQKYIDLNINNNEKDKQVIEYLTLLYSKVKIEDKEERNGKLYYTITYPVMSTNIEKYNTMGEAIEAVKRDSVKYITIPQVEVEVINDKLIINSNILRVLSLIEV